jgi:lactate racemase
MADISIPWGDEQLHIPLPADWTVQQVAMPSIESAGGDWPSRLAEALATPEDSPPLSKVLESCRGGRIALIVEDLTRHSPLVEILKVVFRELAHARVPNENVEIVFATGMHPPLTAEQAAGKIGAELAATVRWRSNLWRDRDKFVRAGVVRDGSASLDVRVDRGVATADLRILISAVSPHMQAGFGGGYKMYLPGCAGKETIRQLHLLGVPRRTSQQVGQSEQANRMRRLINAGGLKIDAAGGRSFGVQYVMDCSDRLTSIAAGNVLACQQMLAKRCAAGYGVMVDAPADVVIANAFPRDFDLWQSFKAIANTCWAVRDNGVLICLTRCPAGLNGMPEARFKVSPALLRKVLRFLGPNTVGSLLTRAVPQLAGDAAFFVRIALQIAARNTVIMVSPGLVKAGARFTGLPLLETPGAAIELAQRVLGKGPRRVIVFPSGGVSYPILTKRPLTHV